MEVYAMYTAGWVQVNPGTGFGPDTRSFYYDDNLALYNRLPDGEGTISQVDWDWIQANGRAPDADLLALALVLG